MSFLAQMTIHGRLSLGYAHLTAEYTFATSENQPQAFRYYFPVPSGGQVTGLQVMDGEGRLCRAELCAWNTENLQASGFSLVQVASGLYCLTVSEPMAVCRVLLHLLLPLQQRGDRCRFVFPTGMETDMPMQAHTCPVSITLELDDMTEVQALNHEIEKTEYGITADFSSGADFVLELTQAMPQSFGMVQENWEETIGMYRLYPQNPAIYRKETYKRALLLLDTTSVRDEKRFAQVKELFLRTLQALPQEMVVQAIFASTPQKLVLPSFMSVGETLTQILFQALKVCPRGGTLREMLEHLPEDAAEETVVILVSSGVSGPLHGIPKIKMPIHLFTIGTVAETPLAELWKKTGWGEHQHFYPGEALSQGTQTANKRLFAYCGKVEVIPQDASVQELLVLNRDLSADGYLDVVCRSHGAPPQEFLLRHHGMDKELLAVAKLSVYSHLPMAVHLFADTKIRGLTRLLSRVDAGSVRAIKKQIEELSLRYDVLSQETMLALHLGKARALVTTQFVLGCGADNRPTVFGEEKRITQISPSVKEECLAMLIEQVRSDGAICELQIAERAERINRTAWAVLALSLEENPSYAAVLKDALAFLAQDTPTGTVGWLYGQRERLAQYLQAHPAEVATILPPLTQIDDVVSAAQMLIKNSLGYAECS